MDLSVPVGASAELVFEVADADTAIALGSGDVEVLATPRAIAWAEAATCAAVVEFLPADTTTVGTEVHVKHLRPSEVGGPVWAVATVSQVAGRRLTFEVELTDDRGIIVLSGTISRVVVMREDFASSSMD